MSHSVCPDCDGGWTFDFQQGRVYCRTCESAKADPARVQSDDPAQASGSATRDLSSSSDPASGWEPPTSEKEKTMRDGTDSGNATDTATASTVPEGLKHTPGPWRWEVNMKSRAVSLNGGVPRFDLTVMDFVRWGMGSAVPRLLARWEKSGLMLMEHASRFAVPVKGREHHSEWFRTLDHPDAHLIAAAPELLAALKLILASHEPNCPGEDCHLSGIDLARAAIAKAEGRS